MRERHFMAPAGFVGSILDEIYSKGDKCRGCNRDHQRLLLMQMKYLPDLYNETDWRYLKGCLESPSEALLNLLYDLFEKSLFQSVWDANYFTLCHGLFACEGDAFKK
ncbi:hypothetical protein BS17DRAFT_763870 [Gyrodon lividus]|nr:hypothetical protein BS17DRAFT_763870 [Gyrodon lividus]